MATVAEVSSDLFLRYLVSALNNTTNKAVHLLQYRCAENRLRTLSSAAHGFLENVEQLLSSGQIQGHLKAAVASVLGADIHERDVSIVSVSDEMQGVSDGKGSGAFEMPSIAVTISIKAPRQVFHGHHFVFAKVTLPDGSGMYADDIAGRMASSSRSGSSGTPRNSYLEAVGNYLGQKIRTVQWNPRFLTKSGADGEPTVIKYGVNDRDKIGCTALHWAALNDRVDIIAYLVKQNADVNLAGDDGHTALHWAALKGHIKASHLLVRSGASLDMQDNWCFTPLIRAAQNGHLLEVLLLLQEGADPLKRDEEGHNCLHWAVYHRHHGVVFWLLQQPALRAYVDQQDTVGQSALHLAARKSGREMCRKLLECGASPAATDNKGQTPEAVALKEQRRPVASYLRWYTRCPQWLRRFLVARGPGGRAFVVNPTLHGALAMGCILLAYVYYACVLLPETWGRFVGAHVLLWIFTGPMVYCFYWSWKGDPGVIPPQPAAILSGLTTDEISMDDVMQAAVTHKHPRAKYSRMFQCYVARFDHDCPWVSNVVGASNHIYFVGFCYFVTVCLTAWDYICIHHVLSAAHTVLQAKCEGGRLGLVAGPNGTDASLTHVPRSGWTPCPAGIDYVAWSLYNRPAELLLLLIYVLYALFTLCMSVAQSKQVASNVTTNELINWHRYPGWSREDGSFMNPYDRGLSYNLRQFFQQYPSCPRGGVPGGSGAAAGEEMRNLLRRGGQRRNAGGSCPSGCAHEHGHGHGHEHGGSDEHVVNIGGGGAADGKEDMALKQQLRDIGFDDD